MSSLKNVMSIHWQCHTTKQQMSYSDLSTDVVANIASFLPVYPYYYTLRTLSVAFNEAFGSVVGFTDLDREPWVKLKSLNILQLSRPRSNRREYRVRSMYERKYRPLYGWRALSDSDDSDSDDDIVEVDTGRYIDDDYQYREKMFIQLYRDPVMDDMFGNGFHSLPGTTKAFCQSTKYPLHKSLESILFESLIRRHKDTIETLTFKVDVHCSWTDNLFRLARVVVACPMLKHIVVFDPFEAFKHKYNTQDPNLIKEDRYVSLSVEKITYVSEMFLNESVLKEQTESVLLHFPMVRNIVYIGQKQSVKTPCPSDMTVSLLYKKMFETVKTLIVDYGVPVHTPLVEIGYTNNKQRVDFINYFIGQAESSSITSEKERIQEGKKVLDWAFSGGYVDPVILDRSAWFKLLTQKNKTSIFNTLVDGFKENVAMVQSCFLSPDAFAEAVGKLNNKNKTYSEKIDRLCVSIEKLSGKGFVFVDPEYLKACVIDERLFNTFVKLGCKPNKAFSEYFCLQLDKMSHGALVSIVTKMLKLEGDGFLTQTVVHGRRVLLFEILDSLKESNALTGFFRHFKDHIDLTTTGDKGENVLMYLARKGALETFRAILDIFPDDDVEKVMELATKDGMTMAHALANNMHMELLAELVERQYITQKDMSSKWNGLTVRMFIKNVKDGSKLVVLPKKLTKKRKRSSDDSKNKKKKKHKSG
jgi:hypothetical protein